MGWNSRWCVKRSWSARPTRFDINRSLFLKWYAFIFLSGRRPLHTFRSSVSRLHRLKIRHSILLRLPNIPFATSLILTHAPPIFNSAVVFRLTIEDMGYQTNDHKIANTLHLGTDVDDHSALGLGFLVSDIYTIKEFIANNPQSYINTSTFFRFFP
jgi:hypothetical protein